MAQGCPKVSVIIPAYNSAEYTVATVESVLQQTYSDLELVVVDDGSTDHTQEALRPYFNRIQYIYKENGGACSARNLGIRSSKGEYVACLDCDDLWLPDKLEHSVSVLEANPEVAFVFTACYLVDSEGNIRHELRRAFRQDGAYHRLLLQNYVPAPTVVIRRCCLNEVGLFDENIFIPADWDLWLKLARKFPIHYIDLPLSKYRMASNYTLRHIEQSLEEHIYVFEKHSRLECELPSRIKDQTISNILSIHAMKYKSISDMDNARRVFWLALKRGPFRWGIYMRFFLSLFGNMVWDMAVKVKRML